MTVRTVFHNNQETMTTIANCGLTELWE